MHENPVPQNRLQQRISSLRQINNVNFSANSQAQLSSKLQRIGTPDLDRNVDVRIKSTGSSWN